MNESNLHPHISTFLVLSSEFVAPSPAPADIERFSKSYETFIEQVAIALAASDAGLGDIWKEGRAKDGQDALNRLVEQGLKDDCDEMFAAAESCCGSLWSREFRDFFDSTLMKPNGFASLLG